MSLLKEEIKPYVDRFGFISPRPYDWGTNTPGSGNGILYTSEYYITLKRLNEIDSDDRARFINVIAQCEVQKGLYRRAPGWIDYNEAQDDYLGLLTASYLINPIIAKQILDYGKKSKANLAILVSFLKLPNWIKVTLQFILKRINVPFNFNNVKPEETSEASWLGRHFPLVTHMYFCAGEKPPFWRKLLWCLGILISCFSKTEDHDAWMLTWLLVLVGQDQGSMCRLVSKIWLIVFKLRFGSTAQGICARTLLADVYHPLGKRFVL